MHVAECGSGCGGHCLLRTTYYLEDTSHRPSLLHVWVCTVCISCCNAWGGQQQRCTYRARRAVDVRPGF